MNKLWYYEGLHPTICNDMKVVFDVPGSGMTNFQTEDVTGTSVKVTYNAPEVPVSVIMGKTVSADDGTYSDSAAISTINQSYRYRLSYAPVGANKYQNVLLYDLIENDTVSRFAGTVTGIDLTGCGDIPVDVYVQGNKLASAGILPKVFSKLPGDWMLIDAGTFTGWKSVDAVALYFGDYIFDGELGMSVYADILMRSIPDNKNIGTPDSGTSDSYSCGVTVTFGSDCQTESVKYDYVELWYQQDGKYYRAGQWGGSDLKNLSVNLPTSDFYLYWRTDSSGSYYYGFDVVVYPANNQTTGG